MIRIWLAAGVAALLFTTPAAADELASPGSVLVYPVNHTQLPIGGPGAFTILSITNTDLARTTSARFVYATAIPDPLDPSQTVDCVLTDRTEFLTPADTLSVLTVCHNPTQGSGYVAAIAEDPSLFQTAWGFNRLVGSELVLSTLGASYSLNAYPFRAMRTGPTDCDADGEIDFDGIEYERIPDDLYVDSFTALPDSTLVLFNLTGGSQFDALVNLDIFNDNEVAFSQTFEFRCWMESPLEDLSLFFSESFLANNTMHDPRELDLDCDNQDDAQTGWFRIQGVVATSALEAIPNPALLGAITHGNVLGADGGRPLWGSTQLQGNGDFFKFSADDPEYPCSSTLQFTNVTIVPQGSGILGVRAVLAQTGMSPVHDIDLSAQVPGGSSTLDIRCITPRFDLGKGKARRVSFEFVRPTGGSNSLTLFAKGVEDSACGGGMISAMVTLPLGGADELPSKPR